MYLNHEQPFNDAVWALEHKCSRKVPQFYIVAVFVVLRDPLAVSVKQLPEGA